MKLNEIKINEQYKQAIPRPNAEEFESLKQDISVNGVQLPLLVNRGNVLLDGHTRYDIAVALGLESVPTEIKHFESDDLEFRFVIMVNVLRRDLTPAQKVELMVILLPVEERLAKARQEKTQIKKGLNITGEVATPPPPEILKGIGVISTLIQPKIENNYNKVKPVSKILSVSKGAASKIVAKQIEMSYGSFYKGKKIIEVAKTNPKIAQEWENAKQGKTTINKIFNIIKNEQKEKDVARHSTRIKNNEWSITKDQDVINCDVVITDPPYGITTNSFEPKELETFTKNWLKNWNTCGAEFIIVFWSQRYLFEGKKWFDELLINYKFQQLLIWHYPNNKKPQSRQLFKQTYEPILFYRKLDSNKQILISNNVWGNNLTDFDCCITATPQTNYNEADFKQHPTQKPLEVMSWLVNALTKENELVCDPFCGSGTTGIACLQQNRKFKGIEINDKFIKIATGRLNKYGKQLNI